MHPPMLSRWRTLCSCGTSASRPSSILCSTRSRTNVLRCTAAYITVVPQHAVRLYCSVQYGHTTAFAARFSLLNKLFAEQGAMLTHGPLSACRRRRATSLRQLYRHSCTAAPPICASCTAESLPRCGTGSQALWRAVSVAPPGIRAAAAARSDCSSRPLSLQQPPALTAAAARSHCSSSPL
eukprot:363450-Chlamydomonas_euryale.AAC.7